MGLRLVWQRSAYILSIGILEGLTKINGEPSIAITWIRTSDDAGGKDIQQFHRCRGNK